ncbi:MAG: UDP-N-acetylmuramate--L-alanine ligase [Treponema sp.]|jgi:UDP-N-acetylmuramate--alanine ligase|nr:UDP-N-acetylmuramate--L-alanine ligase [Treponema sp.]
MDFEIPVSLSTVYFVGIKGTGTCALAELLHNSGLAVSGSDGSEVFYTDRILQELDIPYYESFAAEHIKSHIDLVIYSAAYSPETNPELIEAQKQGIPILKYTDALGAYSAQFDSAGIAGVHGKTTTTAIAGTLIRGAGLPAQVLAGSAVTSFGGHSTLIMGNKYFIAETCEYRRHFLAFHPRHIILTAVESDHQDYFPTYESIRDAFMEYARLLPENGELIYCADDPGACEVAALLQKERQDIQYIPYGFSAEGDFKITSYTVENETALIKLSGFPAVLRLKIPGRHLALDTAAAFALTCSFLKTEYRNDSGGDGSIWNTKRQENVVRALAEFRGSKRRSEILGTAGGILFMDDYAHHPTAIHTTLEGLKSFYPLKRLVVSFMSHTYTRTAALLDEFAASFECADVLILHKIYASAREEYHGGVNGKTLFEKIGGLFAGKELADNIYYIDEPLDTVDLLKKLLAPGDLFITMGAGNNWPLGEALFNYFKEAAK